jgi:hypothetical protein
MEPDFLPLAEGEYTLTPDTHARTQRDLDLFSKLSLFLFLSLSLEA